MKRKISLLLVICMLLTLVACADQTGTGTPSTEANPTGTNPSATQPQATEPQATEPQATQPAATQPQATEPTATQPQATEPQATQPAATQPQATQPAATQPVATQPAVTEPAVGADSILMGSATIDGKVDAAYLPSYRVVVDHTMPFNVPVAHSDQISAKVYFLHDGTYMYVCAVVTGDSAVVDTGLTSWVSDSVEIWFSNPAGMSSKIVMDAYATPWPHNATNNLENKLKIDLYGVELASVHTDNGYIVEMKVAIPYYRKSEGTVGLNVQLNNVYEADTDASNWDTRNGGCFGTQPAKHEVIVVKLSDKPSV